MIVHAMQKATLPLLEKIHQHPFNTHLANGKLSYQTFQFYLKQDALYLAEYARALALTAARLPETHQVQQFLQFAKDAMQAEHDLHASFINEMDVEQSPACFMYSHYLLKMAALAPVEEAVASLLPCFVIYQAVGQQMLLNQTADNPYERWITLYSGEVFAASVKAAIAITNELAKEASLPLQNKMIEAFQRSSRLEWLFWESAWQEECWKI